MFKEKDKRIILLIVFGVAIASFITATIACFISGITLFSDSFRLRNNNIPECYTYAYLLLALFVLCVAYLCVKLFVRRTFIPSLVLAVAIVFYVLISSVALRQSIIYDNGYFWESDYSYFQVSYVATSITVPVAGALAETAHLLIIRMDRKKAQGDAQKEELQVATTEE